MPTECKPPKTRIMPKNGFIIVFLDDREPLVLSPKDALQRGSVLAGECLAAIDAGRLAVPRCAALDLPDCEPETGLLLAERLLVLACRVGIVEGRKWGERVGLSEPDEDDEDSDSDLEPDEGVPALAELLKRDLASVGA
jgi:hypothetical protein